MLPNLKYVVALRLVELLFVRRHLKAWPLRPHLCPSGGEHQRHAAITKLSPSVEWSTFWDTV